MTKKKKRYLKEEYVAPEVLCFYSQNRYEEKIKKKFQKFKIKGYDEKCDIYSFSIILLSLLTYLSQKTIQPFNLENQRKYFSSLEALLSGERYVLPG